MAAGKKTPEPAAKTQKKRSILCKFGVKQAAAATLKAVHSSTFSILSQSTNGRHFTKLVCHAEFLPNFGNLPIPIIMSQSFFCFSSYKQKTREEPRKSMSRNPSRNPSSCNCTWQRVPFLGIPHMVFFLQRNTQIFCLLQDHSTVGPILDCSLCSFSLCLWIGPFCVCSIGFGYENAWELLPKFSVVCGQHITQCINLLLCFTLSFKCFTWFAYVVLMSSCLLHFLIQLFLSLLCASLSF